MIGAYIKLLEPKHDKTIAFELASQYVSLFLNNN